MAAEAIIPNIDTRPSQELPSQSGHFVGLHARLLLGGEALRPSVINIPPIEITKIVSFADRVYSPFEAASTAERTAHWVQKGGAPKEQLTSWKNEMKALMQAEESKDLSKKLASLSRVSGISFDTFAQNEVDKLYTRYFNGQHTELQVKQFVKDVLDAHTVNGAVNLQELKNNLPALTWLSHIFGEKASEMITHLIQAEAQNTDPVQQQTLITQVNTDNRINILNTDETRILEYVSQPVVTQVQDAHPAVVPTPQATTIEPPSPQETPPPIAQRSEFTKPIAEALTRAGINVAYVDATPINSGANHVVYWYRAPGEPLRVLKIAKEKSMTTLTNNHTEEEENYMRAQQEFPGYTLDTQIMHDPDSTFYCIVQDAVQGEALTNKHSKDPEVRKQLCEIIRMNNMLYKKERISLDFVGMPGFFSWVNRQKLKLLQRKSEFEVSNILIDKEGKLKIVDYEFFDRRKVASFERRTRGYWGLLTNRILIKRYFDLDIKKEFV